MRLKGVESPAAAGRSKGGAPYVDYLPVEGTVAQLLGEVRHELMHLNLDSECCSCQMRMSDGHMHAMSDLNGDFAVKLEFNSIRIPTSILKPHPS